LVHYSNLVLAGLGTTLLATLALGTLWTDDEAARITSISFTNSIAYLPYFFAIALTTRVTETPRLRQIACTGAILFRLFAFAMPVSMSDDVLRYEWEAQTLSQGLNPYRVSPAQLKAAKHQIPGYDFAAVYGPVLEAAHWTVYMSGLPLKASSAIADGLLLLVLWRKRWPLWRWMMLAWSPLCIYEYWMNGHNDAWLILLLTLAFLAEGTMAWFWLGLATLTKWWPVFLVPLWLRVNPSGMGVGLYGAMLSSCLLLMPVSEWITKVRYTTGFLGGWQNNPFLYRLLSDKTQVIAIAAAGSAGLWFARFGKAESMVAFITLLLAFSANIHPWYLGWVLPFLASSRWNPMPWLLPMALLPLAYDPMIGWRLNGTWNEDPVLRFYIWTGVTVFAAYRLIRSRNG
jgi:hypothetical protein